MIKVEIRLADGAYHEFAGDEALYQRFLSLHNGGFRGRELIERLLTDDWGSEPTVVTVHGTDLEGKHFRHEISGS